MKDLFQVTVHRIQQLVLEQINLIKKKKAGVIKTIILCGGLGSSPYIKTTFGKFCENNFGGKIQVIRPVTPWSAVCKGAALRGLEVSPILSRRSRCHYGFKVHVSFEDGEHDEEDAFDDQIYGKRAKNQMLWAVKQVKLNNPSALMAISADSRRTRNSNLGRQSNTVVRTQYRLMYRTTQAARNSICARTNMLRLGLALEV